MSASAFRYARYGPMADVLELQKFSPTISNANAQVIVAPKLVPMHRTEAAVVNGTAFDGNSSVFPKVAGFEGIATVADAAASTKFKNGDWVYMGPTGAAGLWATKNVVAADALVPVAKAAVEANPLAACVSCFLTASALVDSANLAKSDVIVQNGGSSLTSLAVTALCKKRGVKVVTAAAPGPRFAAAEKRHKALGAELVVPYTAEGARAAAKSTAGNGGARVFFNGVGGKQFNEFLKLSSADESTCVTYGAQSGYGLLMAGSQFVFKNLSMKGFYLPRYYEQLDAAAREKKVADAIELAKTLKSAYPVETVKGLEGVPAAWDKLYLDGGMKFVIQL